MTLRLTIPGLCPRPIASYRNANGSRAPIDAKCGLPFFALVFIGSLITSLVGCEHKPVTRISSTTTVASESAADDLKSAMDLIMKWEQIDDFQSAPDVLYHLNRWMDPQEFDPAWKPDPLLERMPKSLRQILDDKLFSRKLFETSDLVYLREAFWMREISQWVSRQPTSARFTTWTEKTEPAFDPEIAGQLAIADRLFDWTVRNVQLDALLPVVPEKTLGPNPSVPGKKNNDAPPLPPAARGEAGPGYRHELWHLLFLGHGDAWERARVFMALARQQDLETVMLGIEDPQSLQPPLPWLPAVILKGQLYLFDAELGIPLPAKGLESVLTLEQLQSQPELLEKFSADDQPYRVTKADLENVVAMVDSGPEAVSWRMKKLESNLIGNYRLSLTASPSDTAEKLRKLKSIKKIVPWGVPWETAMYWSVLTDKNFKPKQVPLEIGELQLFTTNNRVSKALTRARNRHFRGEFDKPEGERGAKTYYMDARVPDAFIKTLQSNQQFYFIQAKSRASLWIGLIQYETGGYSAAVDWLKGGDGEPQKEGDLKYSTHYNLARSYEQLGQIEAAREIYLADTSSQKAGNALRAKLLLEEKK